MDKIAAKLDKLLEVELDQAIDDRMNADMETIIELIKQRTESLKVASEESERRKDRLFSMLTQVGIAVGGWICYDVWHRRGLKFEETGIVTSHWTRNLMSRMIPKK